LPLAIKDDKGQFVAMQHADDVVDQFSYFIHPRSKVPDDFVPRGAQDFYTDFGYLQHPNKKDSFGQPIMSTQLAPYQIEAMEYKAGNLLIVKSNKVGMTTALLLDDIQSRLLPENAGYDLLIGAQTDVHAYEHIKDIKRMMRLSDKYRKYLVEKRSNAHTITIENPYYPSAETRIIALGSSERATYSWKKVNKIHLSDVSLMHLEGQKNYFGGLYSRLANTDGQIKIETIPNGQAGEVYRIWLAYQQQKIGAQVLVTPDQQASFADDPNKVGTTFHVMEIMAEQARNAGLITQKFLDQQRKELGELQYQKLYGCKFIGTGNQWYTPDMFHTGNYGAVW